MMKCTACGKECFEETHPEVVFRDEKKCICSECSIDFEQVDGVVQFRQDLIDDGYVEPVFIPIMFRVINEDLSTRDNKDVILKCVTLEDSLKQ